MITLKAAPRGRDIHEEHRASTPLELLFDLTFVVAIALAAAQLHHGVVEHHVLQTLPGYLLAFLAIWWAWMNYTWFASAYDNDDTLYRVLTMMQMGGVLVLATGIPGLFTGQYTASVVGYVVMRLALCAQWLRAAHGDPLRRKTCLRYAGGIVLVQLGWVGFLLAVVNGVLTGATPWAAIAVLWVFELAVPMWAEKAGTTPWHAHHIAERYGLMVIIVLGECVLGATNTVATMWQAQGWSFDLALLGFAGTLLIFSLWWMYFLLPSADALHHHRERAWGWGYGHYILFAAVAAVGAGLEVVADVLKASHAAVDVHAVSPLYAISTVAVAEAIFVGSLWALNCYATRARNQQLGLTLVCLASIALGPIAVAQGLSLPLGLLVLSLGPLIAIAYNEHGRRHCADHFKVQ
ncbi:MAG TPA: low temperature requirement protein A [Candidatus Kapabacteria bacterium]|nr:low temperature requirement protein A [Candidatus Kapabacteria bacterium]